MTDYAKRDTVPGKAGSEVGSGRLGAWLTVLLALPVLGFFSSAAFRPATLRVPLVAGQTMTIWYVYGLSLIGYSLLLGLIYVTITNRAPQTGSAAPAAWPCWAPCWPRRASPAPHRPRLNRPG